MTVVAVAIAASLALSGCSVKDTLDAQLAPKPTTVTAEATVAAVGAPIGGTLAEGFPDTVPLWPGAAVAKSKVTKTPQGKSFSATLTTPDPFANVLAGLGAGLEQAGWKVESTDATVGEQKASILMISTADAEGVVTVSQAPDKPVGLEYVITPKK